MNMTNLSRITIAMVLSLSASMALANHTPATSKPYTERMHTFSDQGLILVNPKARQGKAGQNSAAFVVVKNDSAHDHHIVKATTPVATIVELHTSFEENGVHKMRPVPEIIVPAQDQTDLKSGGYHIMLIGLKNDLQKGQEIPITLALKDGTSIEATFEVKGCCGSCHGSKKKS